MQPVQAENDSPRTLVQRTTSILRERILAAREDRIFLGSEIELLAELGVSRPTLRQTVRVLEREQLIETRRGVGGGFFTRRPSPQAVADIASVYLRSVSTGVTDLIQAQGAIGTQIVRLAAERGSPANKQALVDFVREYQARDRTTEHKWFHEITGEFGGRLAALSASNTLELFMNVLNTLGRMPLGVRPFADRGRRDMLRAYHMRLSQAIAGGEADEAARIYTLQHAEIARWLHD